MCFKAIKMKQRTSLNLSTHNHVICYHKRRITQYTSIKYPVFTIITKSCLNSMLHQKMAVKDNYLIPQSHWRLISLEEWPVSIWLPYVYKCIVTTCSCINLSVCSCLTVFNETECSCIWSWESDSCSSTSSLLPSYVWAEVVACLPTSHRRLTLLGQAGRIFNHTLKSIRFESSPLCKFVTYLLQQFPQQIL